MTTVGIVANPASGRDIRRLVAGASVFDNAEKGNMVFRLMVGLAAVGVERVLMMPAASGLFDGLDRNRRANAASELEQDLPELELVEMKVRHGARDTAYAVGKMCERGVSSIVVLGGDGTNRVVARHCDPNIPLCTLSTGTNNTFPKMQEATVAGLATGLVATGQVWDEVLRREKILYVTIDGETDRDCALVEVAVNSERFVGARALWRAEDISEIVVASASPEAVGLSSIAGLLDPVERSTPHGLYVRLAPPGDADTVLTVPLAPGLIAPVGVVESRRVEPGESVELEPKVGSLALDGEREIEMGPQNEVKVRLESNGPLTINVGEVMREAVCLTARRRVQGGSSSLRASQLVCSPVAGCARSALRLLPHGRVAARYIRQLVGIQTVFLEQVGVGFGVNLVGELAIGFVGLLGALLAAETLYYHGFGYLHSDSSPSVWNGNVSRDCLTKHKKMPPGTMARSLDLG